MPAKFTEKSLKAKVWIFHESMDSGVSLACVTSPFPLCMLSSLPVSECEYGCGLGCLSALAGSPEAAVSH